MVFVGKDYRHSHVKKNFVPDIIPSLIFPLELYSMLRMTASVCWELMHTSNALTSWTHQNKSLRQLACFGAVRYLPNRGVHIFEILSRVELFVFYLKIWYLINFQIYMTLFLNVHIFSRITIKRCVAAQLPSAKKAMEIWKSYFHSCFRLSCSSSSCITQGSLLWREIPQASLTTCFCVEWEV